MKNRYFIVDKNINSDLTNFFSSRGNVIFTKVIDNLYFPVNTHPDVQIHFFDYNNAICCPDVFDYYRQKLPNFVNLISGEKSVEGGYPFDAAYNVVPIGKKLVGNLNYVDRKLLDYYINNDYCIIDVNQGYTRCNSCVVSDNAIITEDYGIYKKLKKNNIDVCLIEAGNVLLKNFSYGFIGGTSFKLDDSIVFLGDIKIHPEFKKIKDFILKYNKKIICASDKQIEDFGSVIYFEY